MNCNTPYSSYAITVRPQDGVTDQQILKVSKWIKKNSDYYHVVTEKSGSSRHIHAGFFLKSPKPRSNVLQMLMQLFKDLSNPEKAVLRKGLRIMYNWDFVDQYLDKDDDTVVIDSSLPEHRLETYFPPRPLPISVKIAKKSSVYYHELEALWFKYQLPTDPINTATARDFLFKMMYSERCLPVIRDDKQIVQTARHLVRWLNKAEMSTIELAPFEKEE